VYREHIRLAGLPEWLMVELVGGENAQVNAWVA